MPEHKPIKVEGRVGDIFAHRFVIETKERRILADLGPKGAEAFTLTKGEAIVAEGEMKPSELKVERIGRDGEAAVTIEHKKKDGPHHEHAEPRDAKTAVEQAGFEPLGEPRRKPNHFEVLARKGDKLIECHVEFDGHIRKEKPVDATDEKWASDIKTAA